MARAIVSQIAKGLNDMHKVGIVHRDVKHLNIFVKAWQGSETGPILRIGDFGMASQIGPDNMINKSAGTVAFMAPEVVLC